MSERRWSTPAPRNCPHCGWKHSTMTFVVSPRTGRTKGVPVNVDWRASSGRRYWTCPSCAQQVDEAYPVPTWEGR